MMEQANEKVHQQKPKAPGAGAWNVELFYCSEDTSIFDVLFRPCLAYGRAEERLRNPFLNYYQGSNKECKDCCVVGPLGCLYAKRQRADIREKYGIDGSPANDCLISTCCACCAVAQHDAEVESRSPKKRGSPDTIGYRPNTNTMSMYAPDRGTWYAGADMRTAGMRN